MLVYLLPDRVTAEALENSMVVGPRQEANLFANRDKFDLVAVYDESSTSFGLEDSPLSVLVRVINEQAFRKMLKRMPMMLAGGIDAWKRDLKESELVRGPSYGDAQIQKPTPTKTTPSALLLNGSTSASGNTAYTNGHNTSTTYTYANGSAVTSNTTGSVQHEVWTPRKQEFAIPAHHTTYGEHTPSMSLDQSAHMRFVFQLFI